MIYLPISTFVKNYCYQVSSRLFVVDGVELKSSEGTQGDPIAMVIYAITVIILRHVDFMASSKETNT